MHNLSRTLMKAALVAGFAASLSIWAASPPPIAHRYSFTSDVSDSVGGANGFTSVRAGGNPVVFANGEAAIDGSNYLELPPGIISSKTNITIETWVTLTTTAAWSRIFDFGTTTTSAGHVGPDDAVGNGAQYLFLSPSVGTSGTTRFTAKDTGAERPILNDPDVLPRNVQNHIAVTYGNGLARLFVNGALKASGTSTTFIPLSSITDSNNWLGRSLYGADAMLVGSFNEFRIHTNILSGLALKASALGSPDSYNYDPGVATNITITVADTNTVVGGVVFPTITGSFSIVGDTVIAPPDVTLTSSATNIVRVNVDGSLSALVVGNAVITASRDGKSNSVALAVSPPPPAQIKHRYSFNSETNSDFNIVDVIDSVGGANGQAIGGVSGTNMVVFTNGSAVFPLVTGNLPNPQATYIDLPDGILSSKTNITIETWVTESAATAWQRIFDFGSSSALDPHAARDPNSPAPVKGYVFLASRGNVNPRFVGKPNLGAENPSLGAPAAMVLGQQYHMVCVLAPQLNLSRLYIDGIPVASGTAPFPLANVTDNNNWLGASQYGGDNPFIGGINEFRIYEGALSGLEVALSRAAGPDTLAGPPGTLQSIAFSAFSTNGLTLSNNVATQLILRANFQNITNVDVTGSGATFTSANTAIFTVNATGAVLPRSAGTANLIADLNGVKVTNAITVAAPSAITMGISSTIIAGQPVTNIVLQGNFGGALTNVNVTAYNGTLYSSSDTNILTISGGGNITALLPGTATVTAVYAGLTNQKVITVVMPADWVRGTVVNRYSFDGIPESSDVIDSIGGANGFLVNSAGTNFTGTGQLALSGGANGLTTVAPYVDLPNGILSNYTALSFEGWVTVRSTANNMRYFDFGMSSASPDGAGGFLEDAVNGTGRDYVFLTPGTSLPRFASRIGTGTETPNITAAAGLVITQNVVQHFVAVWDPPRGVARLYINGRRAAVGTALNPTSIVDDRNNWLGRSQFSGDPLLNGVYDEFRIYNGPLLDADVMASYLAGPNSLVSNARLTATVASGGTTLELRWPATETGFTLQSTTTLSGTPPPWSNVSGVTLTTDGANTKATVPISSAAGAVFYRLQKATP